MTRMILEANSYADLKPFEAMAKQIGLEFEITSSFSDFTHLQKIEAFETEEEALDFCDSLAIAL